MTMFSKSLITLMLLFLVAFTITVLIIFMRTGYEPSELVRAVFLFCSAEAGLLAWIKKTRIKEE